MASQILEFAESGRLIEGPRSTRPERRGALKVIVVAALVLGGCLSLAASGAIGRGNQTVILVAIMCALGALVILVRAVRLMKAEVPARPVKVRPAAVLPPELVRVGNWIHRDGAWLRVEQVGLDGGGRVQALLSSGELVVLGIPVTVAGDDFRPASDPVASLRD